MPPPAAQEKWLLLLHFSRLQILCSRAQHSLLQLLLGPAASSGGGGSGEGVRLSGFVFLPGNGGCQVTTAAPVHCLSTRGPGAQLQPVLITPAGELTLFAPMGSGSAGGNLIPHLSGKLQAPSVAPASTLLSSLLPGSPLSPSFRCFHVWISQTCSCVEQRILC